MITEADAQRYAEQKVHLTLMDGTVVRGYLFTPGYQGVSIQVRGVRRAYRFSEIQQVETASWGFWKAWLPTGKAVR